MAKTRDSEWLSNRKSQFLHSESKINYKNLLITILTQADYKDIVSLFAFIKKNKDLNDLITKRKVTEPSSLCDFGRIARNIFNDLHESIPLENILTWAQLNIENHYELINKFLLEKELYTKYRLLSDFENANRVLDRVEKEFGFSWWLIESKISLYQEHGGKAGQVEYINNLLKNSKNNSFFIWIIENISERNEDKTQLNHFYHRLEQAFDNHDGLEAIVQYVKKTIIKNQVFNISESTLVLDSFNHIIDLYENFINIIVKQFVKEQDISLNTMRHLRTISKKIKSPEIVNCLMLKDNIIRRNKYKKYNISEQGKLFLKEDFENSMALSADLIENQPHDLESILILASGKDGIEKIPHLKGSLLFKIVENIYNFRCYDNNSGSAYSNLKKITANNYTLNLSKIIDSILFDKGNLPLIETTSISDRLLFSNNIDIFNAPILFEDFNNSVSISENLLKIKNIIHSDKNNDIYEIEELTRAIIEDDNFIKSDVFFQNKAYLLNQRANALIALDKTYECILLCVDNILLNKFLLSILPVKKLISGKRWPKIKAYKGSIELSIIIHLYLVLNEDSLQKSNLGFAWDWFRKSHDIVNIEDILNDEFSYLDKEKVIYFLSEISTPEVMESHSEGLDTPESTLTSRSKILSKLIEFDKSKNKFYEKEQVSLLKSISIQKGLDKLNQNKLYIDNNIIKSWANRELETTYERYQETLSNPDLLIDKKENDFDKDDILTIIKEMIDINKDVYITLFRAISEEYLNNKRGGLNFFLSMRIRHGKLESTLRKPLSDNNLITTKKDSESVISDIASDIYNYNSYWVEKLGLDNKKGNELNEKLADLSFSLNKCISDYKNNKIRCRSDKFPYGFFYISPTTIELRELKNKIETGISFDDFCNECIDLCKRDIERRLPYIKNSIDKDIFTNISKKLEDLLRFCEYNNYKYLSEKIKTSRSQFLRTGNLVKEWFNFDIIDINNKSLSIGDCVDISLINITDIHSGYSFSVDKKIDNINKFKLSDIDSSSLNEVLYIMLDNICKRSGLVEDIKIRIKIKKHNNENIKIIMINEVNNNVVSDLNNLNKLNEIKASIDKGIYQNKASDDNNSGLLKLRNMNQSKDNDCLNFGFKFNYFYISYNLKLTVSKGL